VDAAAIREVGRRDGLGQPRRRLICFCCCGFATPALAGGEAIFVRVMRLCLKGIDDEKRTREERRGLGMGGEGIEDGEESGKVLQG